MSESFFPYSPGDGEEEEESGGSRRKLRDGFISESRMTDLATLVKINIIQKLIPGLNKPGYEEDSTIARSAQGPHRRPEWGAEFDDPLSVGFHPPRQFYPPRPPIPAGEVPPGFEDEYELLHPPRQSPFLPGRNPLSIGEDDLNPPGLDPQSPLRGPFFGEGGIPRPGFGGRPNSGMHPTSDHPIFGAGNGQGIYDPRYVTFFFFSLSLYIFWL